MQETILAFFTHYKDRPYLGQKLASSPKTDQTKQFLTNDQVEEHESYLNRVYKWWTYGDVLNRIQMLSYQLIRQNILVPSQTVVGICGANVPFYHFSGFIPLLLEYLTLI